MPVTIHDVRAAIRQLGLSGAALCAHSSLRSFGVVEGGARTIIDGVLAEGCTLLAPTFTYDYAIAPPPGMRPPRNGYDYDRGDETPDAPITQRIYAPASSDIARSMGAIPATLLTLPGRVRGEHQLNSFTALGPQAHALIDGQAPLNVYAPLRSLAAMGGAVVLMGVGLTRLTLLHLAEQMAGRTLFRRWALDRRGQPTMIAVGSCSDGFEALADALAPIERRIVVGASTWRVFSAQAVLERAVATIRAVPQITHCADPACMRCNDAIAGGPLLIDGARA
jgi:aminoglycoside N3'-acetyltransferase